MNLVHKITLSSGKVVLIKDPKIRHMQLAEKLAGNGQGFAFNIELVKQVLYKIDDSEIKKPDLIDIDDLLSVAEFRQIGSVISQLLGNEEEDRPKVEQVFGGQ